MTTTLTTFSAAPLATRTSSSTSSASSSVPPALEWTTSTSYPTEIWTQSCVSSGGFVYCVGGVTGPDTTQITSSVYFAALSSSGVGAWKATTSYPTAIRSGSCVASAGKIYCVGGYNSTTITDDVFYAPLSSSGVGQWKATTSYPSRVWTESCVPSTTGVFCVGGETPTESQTNAVYFAPYSSSGLGAWTSAANYPVTVRQLSCVAGAGDAYCVGGLDNTQVYYAPLTSSGVGAWNNTTGYPFTVGANLLSCVTVTGSIFCVAGHTGPNVSSDVYQATLSTAGVSAWVAAPSYPTALWGLSCVSSGSSVYCSGGENASGAVTSGVAYLDTT